MAQAIRASLLASAMAATLVGRRASSAVSQGRCLVPRNDVAALEEFRLAERRRVTIGPGPLERFIARPRHHVHSESPTIASNCRADTPIAEDTEFLPAQGRAHADLPFNGLQSCHLLRQLPCSCQN